MSRLKLVALPLNDDDTCGRHAIGLRGDAFGEDDVRTLRDEELLDCGRADPNDPTLVAVVEHSGVLRTIRLTQKDSKVRRFQFQTTKDGAATPTSRPWWQFAFIPGQPGAILVVQAESQNLLFTTLPKSENESSLVYLLGKHSGAVTSLAVSTDGSVTATGTEDGSVSVWALDDGRKVASMKAAHDGLVRCVALSGSKTLVSAGRDGVVRIWDVLADGPRLQMMHRLASEHLKSVITLAVTQRQPEYTIVAGSSDGCLHVWRISEEDASARLEKVLDHNKGLAVTCLSFREDESLLALGTQEIGETIGKGTVQLFETKNWSTVASHALISPCLTCEYLQTSPDRLLVCTPQTPPQVFEGALKLSALRRERAPSKIKGTPVRPKVMTEDVVAMSPQVVLKDGREEELWPATEQQENQTSIDDDFDPEAELLDHMATLGVTDPEEIRRLTEAHIHSMAAAKVSRTMPLHEKVYPELTKIPVEIPPKKERTVKMQLDPKWVEIKDLCPRLEDLWNRKEREEQVVDTFGMRAGTLLTAPETGVEF